MKLTVEVLTQTQQAWFRQMSTIILAGMTYSVGYDKHLKKNRIWKDAHVFLSNSNKQNARFTALCTDKLILHLKVLDPSLKVLLRLTDNCKSNFKDTNGFAQTQRLQQFHNINIILSFFVENHGKGPADSIVAIMKGYLRKLLGQLASDIVSGIEGNLFCFFICLLFYFM